VEVSSFKVLSKTTFNSFTLTVGGDLSSRPLYNSWITNRTTHQ